MCGGTAEERKLKARTKVQSLQEGRNNGLCLTSSIEGVTKGKETAKRKSWEGNRQEGFRKKEAPTNEEVKRAPDTKRGPPKTQSEGRQEQ